MDNLFLRDSKFPGNNFYPGEELKQGFIENAQILIVGAGGLGCEIIKNLAQFGVKNMFIVDLDTIELSNLNRQFLFRQKDIGGYKAEVASNFIKKKFPDINIKWSKKKIQEFGDEFFKQFQVIVGGLDNMDARRWINSKVHELVEWDASGNINPDTVIPYIDGGTEGFRGQVHVIQPYTTSCLECTSNLSANRNVYALCTIAETPRIPEHCIEYIYIIKWKESFNRPVDKDSVDDVNWIYQEAKKRGEAYGIEGVTYSLTLGVIKNVIPAIASTNAIIAASSCLEAIKLLSGCSKVLDNYFMYMGHEGLYSSTTVYQKKEDCAICTTRVIKKEVDKNKLLKDFLEELKSDFNLTDPSAYSGNNILYVTGPESFRTPNLYKLEESIEKLMAAKEIFSGKLQIFDESLGQKHIKLKIIPV